MKKRNSAPAQCATTRLSQAKEHRLIACIAKKLRSGPNGFFLVHKWQTVQGRLR